MVPAQRAVVANTDQHWFDHFRPADRLTRVDEVNFWRPVARAQFRALATGEPFFLRLKYPVNAVADIGFFVPPNSRFQILYRETLGQVNRDFLPRRRNQCPTCRKIRRR